MVKLRVGSTTYSGRTSAQSPRIKVGSQYLELTTSSLLSPSRPRLKFSKSGTIHYIREIFEASSNKNYGVSNKKITANDKSYEVGRMTLSLANNFSTSQEVNYGMEGSNPSKGCYFYLEYSINGGSNWTKIGVSQRNESRTKIRRTVSGSVNFGSSVYKSVIIRTMYNGGKLSNSDGNGWNDAEFHGSTCFVSYVHAV